MRKFRGLLYKDFLQLRSALIYNLIFVLFFGGLYIFSSYVSIQSANFDFATGVPNELLRNLMIEQFIGVYFLSIVPYGLISNSMSLDERVNFNKFIISTGVSRDTILLEKTVFGLILSIPSIIYSGIMYFVLFTMINNPYANSLNGSMLFLGCIGLSIFLNSITIFMNTLFGAIRSQGFSTILMNLALILSIGLINVAIAFAPFETIQFIFLGIALGLVSLSVLFIFLSVLIYNKKDF